MEKMLTLLASLLVLDILHCVVATDTEPSCRGLDHVAKFDNLNSTNALTGSFSALDIYEDLYWEGFEPFCTTPLTVSDTVPQSGTCEAAGGELVTATIASGERLSMTVNYKDSLIGCFDLESLWFGCALPAKNPLITPPESCNVTWVGYDANGKEIAEQTAYYRVGLVELEASMQLVQFGNDFKGLASLKFVVEPESPGLNLTLGTSIDTVSYTVYSAGSACCGTGP